MSDTFEIAKQLLVFMKRNGWVIRYESPEAEERKLFGDDATPFAVPLIAGFILGTEHRVEAARRSFVRLREACDCDQCGMGGSTVGMRVQIDGKWQSALLCDPCAVRVRLADEDPEWAAKLCPECQNPQHRPHKLDCNRGRLIPKGA